MFTVVGALGVHHLDAKVDTLRGHASLQRLEQTGPEHGPYLVRASVALVHAKLTQRCTGVAQNAYPASVPGVLMAVCNLAR